LLCDRCKSLDLTVDKFIICNASAAVNIERDPQRHEPRRGEGKFLLKSGRSLKNFATLQKLRANRNICALCELVCRAIERYGHGNVNDKTSCSLSWEVHGRKIESGSSFVNSTRRIRLSWNEKTDTAQEVYMVFVAPRDPLRPNSDATSKWERDTHFLGREFGDQKENQALIKSWLDLCVKEHSDACRDTHGTEEEFKKLIKETYFGVIDVADMQLKSLPIKKGKPEPYVALSYVWGKKAHDELPYVTKRVNIMTHILHGGLETAWDRLPRTIQDAILLVSRLGYRYIWIDSLCIVQDSDSSWRLNARAMHLVYGNAHFTICAADGKDSSVGLRAVNPILRAMRPDQSAREVMSSISGVQSKDDYDSQPMSAECGFGVRLMVTRPLEAVVNDSEWNKRAWTFQERILSRRCLVFAEGRVYFECRSTSISQDIHIDRNNKDWSLDRTNSPLRTLRELQQRPIWFYMTYISMYTGRHLTKPRDILAAFEGISWLLEQYMDAPSLFGLPTSYFDLALLWGPLETLRCRRTRAPSESEKKSCTQDDLGNCTCESFGGLEFPTWSWSGWMGGRIEYQSSMLDGCLLNIREWLKHHTWIQWYIRDEKGHLRPLWEILSQRTDMRSFGSTAETEDDERWRGYPSNGSQGYGIPTQRRETVEVEKVLVERHSIRGEAPGRIRRRARESSPTRYRDDVSVSPSPRYLQDNELATTGPHFSPPPDRGPPPPAQGPLPLGQGRSRRRETKEEDYSRDESPHNRRRIAAEALERHTSYSENEEGQFRSTSTSSEQESIC
jgi:Heterokaryon incompatibility protein (HET)